MKTTKLMLVVLATFAVTIVTVGLIIYLLSDHTYRDCIVNSGTIAFMVMFGWAPAAIVGYDYDKYLNN